MPARARRGGERGGTTVLCQSGCILCLIWGDCASSPPLRCRSAIYPLPWVRTDRLPETQLSTCSVTVVQTRHLSFCRDTALRRTLSEVPSGGRHGQSRTPHPCAVPTILFTYPCGVKPDQIPDQTPTPTITSQAHVTKRDFTFDGGASQGHTAAPFSPVTKNSRGSNLYLLQNLRYSFRKIQSLRHRVGRQSTDDNDSQ